MAKRILVVDDSRAYRLQVARTLQKDGYEVVEAQDGLEALEKYGTCVLTVCDVNMPRMSGLEFVERVGASGGGVVMLTAEAGQTFIDRARAAGAKAWLVKPFTPEQLLGVVQQLAGPATELS